MTDNTNPTHPHDVEYVRADQVGERAELVKRLRETVRVIEVFGINLDRAPILESIRALEAQGLASVVAEPFPCAEQYAAERDWAITKEWAAGWNDCLYAQRAALAAAPASPAAVVAADAHLDNLAALVRQLVRRLRKAAPGDEMPARALDYLKRSGSQGNPMRSGDDGVDAAWDRFTIKSAELAAPASPAAVEAVAPAGEKGLIAQLDRIGQAIGYGRAQQVLGEQWDKRHNCAPRGSIGATIKDAAPAPAARAEGEVPAGWVSVEDRLPEHGTRVLVYVTDFPLLPIQTDEWNEQHEDPTGMGGPSIVTGEGWDEHEFEEVSHWMPLPLPPGAAPPAPTSLPGKDARGERCLNCNGSGEGPTGYEPGPEGIQFSTQCARCGGTGAVA